MLSPNQGYGLFHFVRPIQVNEGSAAKDGRNSGLILVVIRLLEGQLVAKKCKATLLQTDSADRAIAFACGFGSFK